jgi:glutamate-1-semialdehyde 2,1-aminomutase
MKYEKSSRMYQEACSVLVGGVNSPVRAFKAVNGTPLFIKKAKGSKIEDVDGNSYVDYVCSWGPLILGSAHPRILKAIREAASRGTSFGAPTQLETELAELIVDAMPSIQKIRFVNSGTEATMSALRLARAYTKRNRVMKFEGCYHGHVDSLLVKGGSGMATFAAPDSVGVTASSTAETLVAPYNDIKAVERLFEKFQDELAAVIVEPIAGNMGVIPPKPGFLSGLRKITERYGALLVFDEVITGFRVAYGGAQSLFNIKPDLTCLGKVIGGGLPVGAYGGRDDVMDLLSPLGSVYQAGTLSGNPLAMTSGIATLREIRRNGFYDRLDRKSKRLAEGFTESAEIVGCPVRVNRVGSMIGLFFTEKKVVNYSSARLTSTKKYSRFFHEMLKGGIYLPPSAFETIFLSSAHSQSDISRTIKVSEPAFRGAQAESEVAA